MSNEILNSLLKQYEQKKINAELDLEKRKELLYEKEPHLREIEDSLNKLAINTSKNILKTGSSSLEELNKKISKFKEEKSKILKNLNLPDNYLTPHYECIVCNDTGYIMDKNYNTQMCNCLKQKLLNYSFNKSNMSNLNKENFNTFNEKLFSDEVDLSKYKLAKNIGEHSYYTNETNGN